MLKVVLHEPQIPPNTGNIARTCAANRVELHLVGRLGFELSDRYLKRAGLDYWPYVRLQHHPTWEEFARLRTERGGNLIGFSTGGRDNYTQYAFAGDDWLLFGSEQFGLPEAILAACDATTYIPFFEPGVRSLNLSVSAALGLYEAQRQLGHLNVTDNPRQIARSQPQVT